MKVGSFLVSLFKRSPFGAQSGRSRDCTPRHANVTAPPVDERLAADVARLWQRILRSSPQQIFSDAEEAIIDRAHGFDRLPQPGFVGTRYQRGGVLLIGQNPGNDSVGKGLSRADQRQYQLLIRLRDADDLGVTGASAELMNALHSDVMPSWNIVRNVVAPLLRALDGQTLEDISYTNLVKFRTVDSKFKRRIYQASWPATAEQIALLQPALIVALGAGAFNELQRLYQGPVPIRKVRRQIGDSGLPAIGRSDIAEIAEFWRHRSI